MTDTEYVLAAVRIVGWTLDDSADGHYYIQPPIVSKGLVCNYWLCENDPVLRGALADQLTQMVDALGTVAVEIYPVVTIVYQAMAADEPGTHGFWERIAEARPDDVVNANRSMNTIKAIVDSGVLSPVQGGRDE